MSPFHNACIVTWSKIVGLSLGTTSYLMKMTAVTKNHFTVMTIRMTISTDGGGLQTQLELGPVKLVLPRLDETNLVVYLTPIRCNVYL